MDWKQLLEYVELRLRIDRARSLPYLAYRRRHILRILGPTPPDKVGYDDLLRYQLTRTEEGAAPSTINNEMTFVRHCFREARRRNLITQPPTITNIKLGDNRRTGFVDPYHFGRILKMLEDEDIADVAEFAYRTGWRRGEILGLEWGDVSLDARTVRLRAALDKCGQGRVLPYSRSVGAILERRWAKRWSKWAGHNLVFTRRGRPILYFYDRWRSAVKRAGFPGLVFHDLRRSFARNARNAGLQQPVIMRLMGHKTDSMFHRYQIVDEADLRQASERMDCDSQRIAE